MALFRSGIRFSHRLQLLPFITVRKTSSEEQLPLYVQHATGPEKKELLAKLAGNDDPFNMKVLKRGPGTKEEPNLVPSFLDKRIVGCICEEDATTINWMWVHMDEPKRCFCGYWFKLIEAKPI